MRQSPGLALNSPGDGCQARQLSGEDQSRLLFLGAAYSDPSRHFLTANTALRKVQFSLRRHGVLLIVGAHAQRVGIVYNDREPMADCIGDFVGASLTKCE